MSVERTHPDGSGSWLPATHAGLGLRDLAALGNADVFVCGPDEPARQAYFLKRADRSAYDEVMRDQAAKLQAAGS